MEEEKISQFASTIGLLSSNLKVCKLKATLESEHELPTLVGPSFSSYTDKGAWVVSYMDQASTFWPKQDFGSFITDGNNPMTSDWPTTDPASPLISWSQLKDDINNALKHELRPGAESFNGMVISRGSPLWIDREDNVNAAYQARLFLFDLVAKYPETRYSIPYWNEEGTIVPSVNIVKQTFKETVNEIIYYMSKDYELKDQAIASIVQSVGFGQN